MDTDDHDEAGELRDVIRALLRERPDTDPCVCGAHPWNVLHQHNDGCPWRRADEVTRGH